MIRIVFGRAPWQKRSPWPIRKPWNAITSCRKRAKLLETSLKSHPDQFSIRLHCRPSKSSTTPMFPGKIPKCLSCSQQLASNSANKPNQAAQPHPAGNVSGSSPIFLLKHTDQQGLFAARYRTIFIRNSPVLRELTAVTSFGDKRLSKGKEMRVFS